MKTISYRLRRVRQSVPKSVYDGIITAILFLLIVLGLAIFVEVTDLIRAAGK